ncbi:hypothetical protein JCM8097_007539 [Rhodosporidiobolus ruineniae]
MAPLATLTASPASALQHVEDKGFGLTDKQTRLSPFDRLPDEVALHIIASSRSGWSGVSKRLRRLAREHYSPTVTLRSAGQNKIYGVRAFGIPRVVEAHYVVPRLSQRSGVEAVLGAMGNLRILTIVSSLSTGAHYVFPCSFTDTLSRLPSVRELSIDVGAEFSFEDTTFSLATALPRLTKLEIGSQCHSLYQLMTPTPIQLEHLSLVATPAQDDIYELLPWSNLVSLDLNFETRNSMTAFPCILASFCRSFRKAILPAGSKGQPARLPLRRFTLYISPFSSGIDYTHLNRFPQDVEPTLVEWVKLVKLLNLTSVNHLDLHLWFPLVFPAEVPAMPSITSLTLICNEMHDDDSINDQAFQLLSLLPYFPSLRRLRIDPFPLNRYGVPDLNVPHPSTTAYLFRHPVVAAVLFALQDTAVVQFSFPYEDGCDYRWTRAEVGEPFEAERYRAQVRTDS